jgi:hypothetical protein
MIEIDVTNISARSPLQALEALRASDRGNILERGSWQEDMVSKCRTRLSIRPHSSRAVLFYSQKPNGEADSASLHGACPVLSKSKYAANLWVWNSKYSTEWAGKRFVCIPYIFLPNRIVSPLSAAPRQGFLGAPLTDRAKKEASSPTNSPEMKF